MLGVTVVALVSCGPVSDSSGTSSSSDSSTRSAAGTNGSAQPETNQLSGIWKTKPMSPDQIDAESRDRFTAAQVDEFERTNPQGFSGYHTEVIQLHFAGDQLVISTSKDGGTAHEGWTGVYVIQDSHTYFAGGGTGPLYIAVNFTIDGDRLSLDLITDRLPDHSPWNAGDGIYPRSISREVDDTMNQTVIYDISSFTRVG